MKKFNSVIIALCLTIGHASTSNAAKLCTGTPTVWVTGINLNSTSGTISVGSSATVTATVAPLNATDKNVFWSSSAPSIANVAGSGTNNATGTISAYSQGTAYIYAKTSPSATVDGVQKSATYTVTVPNPYVAVTSVSLSTTSVSLESGGDWTSIYATINPPNATVQTVNWSSNNTSRAYLDYSSTSSGGTQYINSGNSTGSATITATAEGKSATCSVTVTPPIPCPSCHSNLQNVCSQNLFDNSCSNISDYTCTEGTQQNGTFSVWSCPSPSPSTIYGKGSCSATVGAGNQTASSISASRGGYCWCQLCNSSARTSCGLWVFRGGFTPDSACNASSCACNCKNRLIYSAVAGATIAELQARLWALCSP